MHENGALKYRSSMVVILSTISDSHKLWIIAINSKKKSEMKKKIMNLLNLDYIFFDMNLMITYMYCTNKINVLSTSIHLHTLINQT